MGAFRVSRPSMLSYGTPTSQGNSPAQDFFLVAVMDSSELQHPDRNGHMADQFVRHILMNVGTCFELLKEKKWHDSFVGSAIKESTNQNVVGLAIKESTTQDFSEYESNVSCKFYLLVPEDAHQFCFVRRR